MQKVRSLFAFLTVMLITLLSISISAAQTPVQVDFCHAMTGNNGTVVTELVSQFNETHPDIQIVEQAKGNYDETLNAVIAAAGQGEGPNIAQIFDLGTPLAIDSGFFAPLQDALTEEQFAAVQADVLPPLLNYFTVGGKLWSLPWNNSTPLLYYNKDMFEAAG